MTEEETQDLIKRSYASLVSLKDNLPDRVHVKEDYVLEYHKNLDKLEECGFNVAEFRIPDTQLKRLVSSFNYRTGAKTYKDYRAVEKSFLLLKLNALLNYFTLNQNDSGKTKIGFRTDDN